MAAIKKFTGDSARWLATSDIAAGALLQHPIGLIGVLNNDAVNGQMTELDINAQVEIDNSGVAFSAGDLVGYNASTRQAVASLAGDFDCGRAVLAAGTTDKVLVYLNAT